ncbi:endosomal/lysosomal proton channel TMEM175 isoform X3 [Rattus norvegicus]|uniref:endosomal/lysosomal proton channel TMEM175 isoform X3 n=2 Tax=Rattus norvegicus TaxID=10116 RepID=UPI0003D0B3D6|nr:endosomal/lysosomal proton channel TMEM175 isoform X3 [Rattus norvegicus]|eukprot:XP_017454750.1 PREDICTED: endosomal/lysomomal potassium channel TMEM175 isoform X2 [Rattus norvegicus]
MSRLQVQEQAVDSEGDSSLYRRDEEGTQSSHRMLGFSDALLSIIATVMILPVTHTEISPEQQFDKSIQKLLATRIAVYLMTFLIVTVAWAAHTRLFQVVGKIDDTLALLNLACMMTITLLPYTFSLMVTFPDVPLGIFLFCMCVIAIGSVQSYLLMVTVIFLPHISKATTWCKDKFMGHRESPAHNVEPFSIDLHAPLSKERVEAFSDGVYAIVATLLILDICEDNVPDPKDVQQKFSGSLVAALGAYGPQFLAYFGSFATVGLLWFAHHSLFLHVRKATQTMGLFNILSLAFVGGLPLAYQQTSAFARQPRDELERVRVSCAIIFFASIFQFAIWTTALLHQRETLQPAVQFGGQEHAFMFAKLALYPCASLLAFAATCLLSRFSTAIFHLMQIAVPFAFLLLRLLVRLALAGLQVLWDLWPERPQQDQGEPETQSQLLPASC